MDEIFAKLASGEVVSVENADDSGHKYLVVYADGRTEIVTGW